MSLPDVHRCECGHVSEWHYTLGENGRPIYTKAAPPGGRTRCPESSCDCPVVTFSAEAEPLAALAGAA